MEPTPCETALAPKQSEFYKHKNAAALGGSKLPRGVVLLPPTMVGQSFKTLQSMQLKNSLCSIGAFRGFFFFFNNVKTFFHKSLPHRETENKTKKKNRIVFHGASTKFALQKQWEKIVSE